jgi:hypothetical protein
MYGALDDLAVCVCMCVAPCQRHTRGDTQRTLLFLCFLLQDCHCGCVSVLFRGSNSKVFTCYSHISVINPSIISGRGPQGLCATPPCTLLHHHDHHDLATLRANRRNNTAFQFLIAEVPPPHQRHRAQQQQRHARAAPPLSLFPYICRRPRRLRLRRPQQRRRRRRRRQPLRRHPPRSRACRAVLAAARCAAHGCRGNRRRSRRLTAVILRKHRFPFACAPHSQHFNMPPKLDPNEIKIIFIRVRGGEVPGPNHISAPCNPCTPSFPPYSRCRWFLPCPQNRSPRYVAQEGW